MTIRNSGRMIMFIMIRLPAQAGSSICQEGTLVLQTQWADWGAARLRIPIMIRRLMM